ncbi:MAG TPA: MFS transporter [Acidimicrobiales bacterium]|nr:MFS transporter [Acidimicrobiales bacterium]
MEAGEWAEAREREGIWSPARRRLTVGLVLNVTLVAFEALAVATVLPVVTRHLGDLRLYGWVFSAFLLASLVGIVVAGTLADRVAVTGPMLGGLVLFAAGLVIGGTAPDMAVLVAGRAVQGLGAGVVPATAYVAISRGYPSECRPRMFAVLSTAWVVPGLVGPSVAAVVATVAGWRWVFLELLPLVAVAGVLASFALQAVPPPPRRADRDRPPLPALPIAGVVAGAAAVLAALTSGRLPALVPGVLAGAALLAVSLRRLTPAGTLAARAGLPATILTRGLLTFTFYAGDAYVPYAITTARHAPTVLAGLALTASTITWCSGSWIQARVIRRWGPRRLVRTGLGLVLAALVLMVVVLLPGVPVAVSVGAWGVAGLGMGMSYSPLSVTTLDRAPAGEEGRATSGLQLTDVLGQALGTGAAGAIVAVGVRGLGLQTGVALTFGFGVVLGLVAVTVAVRVPRHLLGTHRPAVEG